MTASPGDEPTDTDAPGRGAASAPAGPAPSTAETGPDEAADDDPIVAEVRAIREALFAAAGYDLAEFCRQIRASEVAEGRTSVVRPRRVPERP